MLRRAPTTSAIFLGAASSASSQNQILQSKNRSGPGGAGPQIIRLLDTTPNTTFKGSLQFQPSLTGGKAAVGAEYGSHSLVSLNKVQIKGAN
jgi:hypothetical protein